MPTTTWIHTVASCLLAFLLWANYSLVSEQKILQEAHESEIRELQEIAHSLSARPIAYVGGRPLDDKMFRVRIERVTTSLGLAPDTYTDLLLGTAAVESEFGTHVHQRGGPALGVFEMEPSTDRDIWRHFLKYRPKLLRKVQAHMWPDVTRATQLEVNLDYQIAMAVVHYLRRGIKESPRNLAATWKRHFNTWRGKGATDKFNLKYSAYVADPER